MTEKLLRDVEYNYKMINERIAQAAEKSGRRREDITFLAATKTVDAEVINHAISLGLDHIGENRVQELLSKYEAYDLEHCSLQFIGHLQTNKVRQIVDKVDLIQSVDSFKLAKEISAQSLKRDRISELPAISVKGLMTIPPICDNKHKISNYFYNMHKLFLDISQKKLDNISMTILSMGMSADYYEAILEGANMVRVGSALFGARNYT